MREFKHTVTRTLLAVVVSLLAMIGMGGVATAATAQPVHTAAVAVAQPSCGDTSSYPKDNLSQLPPQATDTVNLIKKGGPYPYKQDGTVFQNRENLLPACSSGYYHEYTVKTPGDSTRGARRIITGSAGEYFYTADHYASFSVVDIDR